jgi:molybdate-binding protein/DNA-binding XRE family transcriptional regulator
MRNTPTELVETNLAQLRRKRGFPAAALARLVNATRQTIYAIEAGDYVPNTALALRLARALEVTVDDLFSLPASVNAPQPVSEPVRLLSGSGGTPAGQPVQLCRVGRQLIAASANTEGWRLPASDAIVTGKPSPGGRTRVQVYNSEDNFQDRILLAGCDPAVSVLARHMRTAGVAVVSVQRNSSQALELLREGCVHLAGMHLRDDESGESNVPEIRRQFPDGSVALVSFAVWEEGILTAPANPKRIKAVADLARKSVSIVNRENGAGSRRLLDAHLKRLNIDSKLVRGYDRLASGHFSAARQVSEGNADCCIATRATARAFGLHFIPLLTERYDLAIRRRHLKLPAMEKLLDVLNRSTFRRELEGIGGYETRVTGQRVL